MLSDPQSLTVSGLNGGAAMSLPRTKTSNDGLTSTYSTADGSVQLSVSRQGTSKQRTRYQVRVDYKVIATDPVTAGQSYQTGSVYWVIDQPLFGVNDALLDNILQGLKTWSSSATVLRVLGDES